jgi:tRNA nucleotidyltransferase (CCA-adding enzyme)
MICHRIRELKPETILRKLEAIDAFRRPERFEKFLIACEADARGRTGFEDNDYPQAKYFRDALMKAKNIDINDLVEQGLGNEKMAEAIAEKRIMAITNLDNK